MPTVAKTNPRLEGPPAPKSRKRRSDHAIHAMTRQRRLQKKAFVQYLAVALPR
jgi:hypothetical protein